MSLEAITEQAKAILSSVAGVGVVHDYQRVTVGDWGKFLNQFQDAEGRINTWMISREKTSTETTIQGHEYRSHNLKIRGYYGLEDDKASEIVFQNLVELICTTFRAKYKLNNTANNTEPIQVEIVEPRRFGGVLCNFCELLLVAEEYEARS